MVSLVAGLKKEGLLNGGVLNHRDHCTCIVRHLLELKDFLKKLSSVQDFDTSNSPPFQPDTRLPMK